MTRARRKLVLGSANQRRWYGEYRAALPSRFIAEVPQDLLERVEPAGASIFQAGLWAGGRTGFGRAGSADRRAGLLDRSAGRSAGLQDRSAGRSAGLQTRDADGFRRGPSRVREASPSYAYHDEDQSQSGQLEVGMRVRHSQFGVGTVLSVEPTDGDVKLVVRFVDIGTKRLLARYAKLKPA